MALLRFRATIGAKIFCAFVAMAAMLAALGFYSIYVLAAAGGIVADTYDRPLMAINYARAASQTFTEMEKELLRRRLEPEAEHAAIDRRVEDLSKSFFDDLDVALERSLAEAERGVNAQIRTLAEAWNEARRNGRDDDLAALSHDIAAEFDRLIELSADHGFVERRKGITAIARFENTSIAAAVAALLLAALVTLVLTRLIIRPLATAARVADRIAGGELETPIPNGGRDETGILLRSMAVMRDSIRTMMERETAQRRSAQSRLIDALESSREGMVLVDAAGRVVIANTQIAAFLPPLAPYLVEGADFDIALKAAGPFLRRPDASESLELGEGEFQRADGRWIRISRSTTRDGGFFLFLSDFTEVKERERRYREAQEQAEAASRAKSSFLATMSHELRTPLNAIIGFSDIMAGEMFGALGNPHYRQYAADILNSGRHLLDIINGVLDLAKSETGKLTIEREPVPLAAVLEASVAAIREPCARAALRLETGAIDLPALVLGDAAKLAQIFGNLLSNAVKFTEPGGLVSVRASAMSDGRIAVTVSDTGIGMAAEDITVALAPFGQVDNRLARRYEGTGLGLPLAKALVELHGGTLLITSAPGKGTSVTVTLPALQTVGEAQAPRRFAQAS